MSQLIDHIFCDPARMSRSGVVEYSGRVLTTTAGTLSAAAGAVDTPLFTLTKVAAKAGRYRVQLIDSRGQAVIGFKLVSWWFGLVGLSDTAYTTTNGISNQMIRNDLINTAGTLEIQYTRSDTEADAEVVDGTSIALRFAIKKSSATP